MFYSAGVGRTGTYIAVDSLLHQAHNEGMVDIYKCVGDMRKNRMEMVQTLVSYASFYLLLELRAIGIS